MSQSELVAVESSQIINTQIERLWAEVANFSNVAAWHPDVTESRLEDGNTGESGNNVGVIRIIKLRNGAVLRERLVAIDPAAHSYTYSVLDGQLPLRNHVSSLTMRAVDANCTEVTWKASFVPAGAPPDALADGVRSGVLELG